MSFKVYLADRVIEFQDIIELNAKQQNYIHQVSSNRTQSEWIALDKGIKIPLDSSQQTEIISLKNSLVAGKDRRDLIRDDTIVFTQHARERIAVRVDKATESTPPSVDSVLLVIQLVIDSDRVDAHAEWKGFTNLTYTLYHTEYDERFKITVSFEMINRERIRVITVSNEHIVELTKSLRDNPEMMEKLQEFKKKLR
ncbi:hypothetical protein B5M42_004865 [Paenibacillus athensensis]|uniref:Uncharacterized protein n=1 Tax=Paenibacillus athensensis TaxID=1967502 RepID=A0A4Y8PVS4_9BACL|nr:hypothetical protein [Paenibacillus athensensis]MCD1258170.1 hypothetical protein [Paenibacillus athensensis]